jgi:hypothetical protein
VRKVRLIRGRRLATKRLLAFDASREERRALSQAADALMKVRRLRFARVASSPSPFFVGSRKASPRIAEGWRNAAKGSEERRKPEKEQRQRETREWIFTRERENETASLAILTVESFPEERAISLNASDYFHQLLLRFAREVSRSRSERQIALSYCESSGFHGSLLYHEQQLPRNNIEI